jgi:acyl-CoA hydrolase
LSTTEERLGMGLSQDRKSLYITMLAVDDHGRPVPVPELVPSPEREQSRFDAAALRRVALKAAVAD